MATYQETVRQGNNLTTTWKVFDAGGLLDYTVRDSDYGNDGVVDQRETTDYSYDAAGRLSGDVYSLDYGADGFVEYQSFGTRQYNDAGQLIVDRDYSQDWDGDGNPDYSNVTSYAYNASGQATSIEIVYLFNGTPNGIDYRLESFTFDVKGRLSEHYTDDWSIYDFVVGKKYTYNSADQVTKVQTMDEYTFGDTKWHTAETYKYSGGRLVEQNDYATYMNGMYVLEDKAKFTYNSKGLVSKEKHTGQDASWHTITGYQDEFWYDSQNRLTTQLTSFDIDGNGVYEAGTRTLQKFAYSNDGTLISHTVDEMTGDGIIEYAFTSELLVA